MKSKKEYNILTDGYSLIAKLGSCPSCGQQVYTDSKICPHCGHEFTEDEYDNLKTRVRRRELKSIIWGLLFFLLFFALVFYFAS